MGACRQIGKARQKIIPNSMRVRDNGTPKRAAARLAMPARAGQHRVIARQQSAYSRLTNSETLMKRIGVVAGLLFVGVLSACANAPYAKRTIDRQAAYTAAAGAPQNNFRFSSTLYSWEPLGETQLVVYTKPKEAYLLDLKACHNLLVTNAIELTSRLGQVSVGFDRVRTAPPRISCVISQIRPVDMGHLKAVQQAQRKIDATARETTPAE
jgi:hypothetical protein